MRVALNILQRRIGCLHHQPLSKSKRLLLTPTGWVGLSYGVAYFLCGAYLPAFVEVVWGVPVALQGPASREDMHILRALLVPSHKREAFLSLHI